MPSRVRIVASHPKHGHFTGPYALKTIEQSVNQALLQIPVLFASWPRWKRCAFLAKCEGTWKIRLFREPRRADMKKSLYGKEILLAGLKLPPKIRKHNSKPIPNVYGWNYKAKAIRRPNLEEVARFYNERIQAGQGIPVLPLPPNANQQLNFAGIINQDWPNEPPFVNVLQGNVAHVPEPRVRMNPWDHELEELIRRDQEVEAMMEDDRRRENEND